MTLTAHFTPDFFVDSPNRVNQRPRSAPVVGALVTTEAGIVCMVEGERRFVPWGMIRYVAGLP